MARKTKKVKTWTVSKGRLETPKSMYAAPDILPLQLPGIIGLMAKYSRPAAEERLQELEGLIAGLQSERVSIMGLLGPVMDHLEKHAGNLEIRFKDDDDRVKELSSSGLVKTTRRAAMRPNRVAKA